MVDVRFLRVQVGLGLWVVHTCAIYARTWPADGSVAWMLGALAYELIPTYLPTYLSPSCSRSTDVLMLTCVLMFYCLRVLLPLLYVDMVALS